MNKKIFYAIILSVLLLAILNLIFITVFMLSFRLDDIKNTKTDEFMQSVKSETDSHISYVLYDNLYYNGKIYDGYQNSCTFAVVDDYSYSLIKTNEGCEYGKEEWKLERRSLSDKTKKILYNDIFNNYYNKYSESDWAVQDVYYYDGKIVINDLEKVVEYNLSTEVFKTYSYADYNFPIGISVEAVDKNTLKFTKNGQTKELKLDNALNQSKSLKTIFDEFNKENTWDKKSKVRNILAYTDLNETVYYPWVEVNSNKCYIFGTVYNKEGWQWCVLTEYDFESNSVKFVDTIYTGDTITDIYFVYTD